VTLDLVFGRTGETGPTRLVSRRVAYPFSVANVFRLDPTLPDMATVILQSASGGLFEGENLSLLDRAAAEHARLGNSLAEHIDCRERIIHPLIDRERSAVLFLC